ncbi:MAG: hypothetical protein JWM68_1061 [Verrucomicrobiales bacterium]|nr:hypothetical protein [Verrucomicrobiales bacterium]
MQSKAKTVNEYLAELPPERRAALSTLRALIRKTVPGVIESMQYGMPGYVIGEVMLGLASQKHYMAFYCCDTVVDNYRSLLGKLNCGKSCIRFKNLEELPLDVIATIIRDIVKRKASKK